MDKPGFLTPDGTRAVVRMGSEVGIFDADTGDLVVDEALSADGEKRIGVGMSTTSAKTSIALAFWIRSFPM